MVGRTETVRRDADGLLVQERQQLHASGFRDGVDVDRQVRAAARGLGQRLGVPADQPDPGAGSLPAAASVPAEASHSASFSTVTAMPSPDRTARSWAGSSTAVETVSAGPGQDAGGHSPDEAGKRLAFGEADGDGQRAVAEDVALRTQAGDVLGGAELFGPGAGVGGQGALQRVRGRRRSGSPWPRPRSGGRRRGRDGAAAPAAVLALLTHSPRPAR